MASLKERIRARAAFGFNKLKAPYDMGGDNTDESSVFALGAKQENARLDPLIELLTECLEAATAQHDASEFFVNCPICRALAKLDALLA